MWLYNNQLIWQKTVEEFLFKGFHDKLINMLVSTPKRFLNLLDVTVPVKKLGYLYGVNTLYPVQYNLQCVCTMYVYTNY